MKSILGEVPKVLMAVGDLRRPLTLLDLLISDYLALGFERIVLLTGYQGIEIQQHVDQMPPIIRRRVTMINDPFEQCGTGLAVIYASTALAVEQMWVAFGDARLQLRDPSILAETGGSLSRMLVKRGMTQGNVHLNTTQDFVMRYDKNDSDRPPYFEFGLTFLNLEPLRDEFTADMRKALESRSPIDLGQIYSKLIDRQLLSAKQVEDEVFDFGVPEGYHRWAKSQTR